MYSPAGLIGCVTTAAYLWLPTALLHAQPAAAQNFSTDPQPQLDPEVLATFRTSFPDCTKGILSKNLVCNQTATPAERAAALVSLFTLEELANNTGNSMPGVPRLGLPPYQVWGEALHGIFRAVETKSGPFSWTTSFPQPILTAASLNSSLFHLIGDIIGTQARAFSNDGRYGLDAYSPNINGFRSPVWGRGQETPGEDTFCLASRYAFEYISGLQGGVDPQTLKIAATAKHFVGYDLENWHNHSRLGNDLTISAQDLAEYYTPQFRTAAGDAKAHSFMCSYNAVNGVPSCASYFMLQTVLRDSFQLPEDSYVSSDCGAVYGVFNPHRFALNETGAVASANDAGVDIDCGSTYQKNFVAAVNNGDVARSDIERGLVRIYSTLVRLGYFDGNASQYRHIGWSEVERTDALDVSYEAAVQGIVLLKNERETLPLSNTVRRVALIGPWANATTQMLGNYYGPPRTTISPLAAFQASGTGLHVNYAMGTNISSDSTNGFAAALTAAKDADAIVFAGGIDNTVEAEGLDRENVTWPGNQLELITSLAELKKPLVVLQMGGGQVDGSSLKADDRIGAIVWAGYPGQSGGKAILDILTGKRAPAGRLTTTQYPAEYVNRFPATDMALRPNGDNPGQTYMWYTGESVYPFGHGLFYTSFREEMAGCHSGCGRGGSRNTFNTSELLSGPHPGYQSAFQRPFMNFTVSVTNMHQRASDYTAMLFANTTSAGPGPYPNKWLVEFGRLHALQPGASQTLTLPVTPNSIARTDNDGNRVLYPGSYELALNNERTVVAQVTLVGSPQVLIKWPVMPSK